MLNAGAVIMTSKRQDVVALSTIKAKYVAVSRAGQTAVNFRQLMQDVHQRCTVLQLFMRTTGEQ
jgi:hypothetical protein